MKALRIAGWSRFEKSDHKKCKNMTWVATPTSHDGIGFLRLLTSPDGLRKYGGWHLILQVAAKCPTHGLLVSDSGRPIGAMEIALKTRASEDDISLAIEACLDIGWLEWADVSGETPEDSGDTPQSSCLQDSTLQDSTGQNTTEHPRRSAEQSSGAKQAPIDLPERLRETWREIMALDGPEVANRALSAGRRIFHSPSPAQLLETWKCAASKGRLQDHPDQWPDFRQAMKADRRQERAPGAVQADAETLDLARQWDAQDRQGAKP